MDGAHAPGSVPIDLDAIGAGYYTGNAHKWLCAPKGAAFLHVRRDLQSAVHSLVISHGYEADQEGRRFREEFDWTGTRSDRVAGDAPTASASWAACCPAAGPR